MKLLLAVALLVLVLVPLQWENACGSASDSESDSVVQCREEERSALVHIKASIHFPIHSLDGKWEGKECCRWERVTCHPITGHVTQLDLGVYDDDISFDFEHGGILLNASMFLPLRQLRSLSLSRHRMYNCTGGDESLEEKAEDRLRRSFMEMAEEITEIAGEKFHGVAPCFLRERERRECFLRKRERREKEKDSAGGPVLFEL